MAWPVPSAATGADEDEAADGLGEGEEDALCSENRSSLVSGTCTCWRGGGRASSRAAAHRRAIAEALRERRFLEGYFIGTSPDGSYFWILPVV